MHSKMMQWSRGLYLAGIVLALILVVPTAWFPFQLAKIAVFSVFLLASAACFLAGGGARELPRARGFLGALLVAFLPLAYLVSMFFSVDRSIAISGFAVDPDTVLFVLLAALALVMGFVLFRTLRTVRLLLTVMLWSLVLAAIFQLISIIFGSPGAVLTTFVDRSVNLVGKWNDLGLLIGLLVTFILAQLEFASYARVPRIVALVFAAVLAVLLAFVNFPLAWILLLCSSLVIALISFLSARGDRMSGGAAGVSIRELIPWLPLVAAAVSIIFIIFGSTFNTGLTSLFPVSSLEVRPSYSATTDVISAARQGSLERLLVGTGPNTFGEEWLKYKPTSVNQSNFWNLDFNVGFSSLTTAFGTVGLLGALAWLIPALLVLVAALRTVRLSLLTREDRAAGVSLVLGSLFLLGGLVLYVPSPNLILVGFALSGAAFGFLWRQGRPASEVQPSRISALTSTAFVILVVVLLVWTSFATAQRAVAESLVGQGSVALSAGDNTTALSDATRALSVEKTGDTLRFALQSGSSDLAALAQSTTTPTSALQTQFASVLQSTLSAGQAAVLLNPKDYRPVLALAELYDFLNTLKIQGAGTQAATAYNAAQTLDPTNPQIPLLMARFEASLGNSTAVQSDIKQSLTLKSNYTDAMLFVVQLAVANNDLNTAVQAAQAAVQSAPGVPSLWFELGLLLYSGKDTKDAVPVLQQAVTLEPDYANAQYFLGLSQYAQGSTTEAIAQFENLQKSNPGNTDVDSILANMQAGKDPFGTSTPPQQRTTAPVTQ